MSRISVLVASTAPDVKAEGIATAVLLRPDMELVARRCVSIAEVEALLQTLDPHTRCALVLVGKSIDKEVELQRWLAKRNDLVVMYVDVIDDIVRVGLRDPDLDSLLSALRDLVESAGGSERVAHMQLRSTGASAADPLAAPQVAMDRPLLQAAIKWIHALFKDAVLRVPDENDDAHGFSITRQSILELLDLSPERLPGERPDWLSQADTELDVAFAGSAGQSEPLAVAARVFHLGSLEFRLMLLALAPEVDPRYQRCIGFLLDEMGRRVGTLGLFSSLLGSPAKIRNDLADVSALTRWRVFESQWTTADEPLRLDPYLTQWLLGNHFALSADPRVRRSLRLVPWPGASLINRSEESANASRILDKLGNPGTTPWFLLDAADPSVCRALIELGAHRKHVPTRVEPNRLSSLDPLEIEESARRIARMTRLTGSPLCIDVTRMGGGEDEDDWMRLFLMTLDRMGCKAALISRDEAHLVRLLGSLSCELVGGLALSAEARIAAVKAAASGADLYLTSEAAEEIANRYPLRVDGLEDAMRLARHRPEDRDTDHPALARFTAACRELTSEGVGHFAQRIEPVYGLDNVVLPPDRKQQLFEIVDHIRLAPHVLDVWKFGEQLPYGRGVAALFFGPSGTGKTMAAMGVARRLGIQILRLDLSKVVSKYIGDTEKNIDRVFEDAQRSGSAILIDEADALLGKRSQVKDAHDRYANIEVAYLLQRLEAYAGLAILTTNMRQNLDTAFLRRLRFVVEFPRPDVEAREKIWRQCLPAESHKLDDAEFRQLARKIDLTGGHIRQITLRAAFIAAAADTQINLEHIAQATRAELAKLGMPPIELDLSSVRRVA